MNNLTVVLIVLKEHQLFSKCSKCDSVDISCFSLLLISRESIGADPKNTEVVKNWPKPLTPTDIQIFLGLARYCRTYVDWFESIASPLTTLTKKNVRFEWS